jgi:hypothetical protein
MSTIGTALLAFGITFVVVLLALLAFNFGAIRHWGDIHTGTSPVLCGQSVCANQPYYGFWSGFGSDLGEATLVAAVIGGTVGGYRKINCHSKGCWRIGHYELHVKHNDSDQGTVYKVCRKCHPHIDGAKFRRHELHQMHHRHMIENLGEDVPEKAVRHDGT